MLGGGKSQGKSTKEGLTQPVLGDGVRRFSYRNQCLNCILKDEYKLVTQENGTRESQTKGKCEIGKNERAWNTYAHLNGWTTEFLPEYKTRIVSETSLYR